MKKSRRESASKTKEVLIDVALEVFSEKGFVGSTTKDIASRAGVTDGLIYHYFASKEEIMTAILDKHNLSKNINEFFDLDNNKPVDHVLINLGYRLLELMHEKSSFIVMFFGEAQRNPIISEKLENLVKDGVEILESYLKERVKQGELKKGSMSHVARLFLGSLFIYFLTNNQFKTQKVEESRKYINSVVQTIYEGIKK